MPWSRSSTRAGDRTGSVPRASAPARRASRACRCRGRGHRGCRYDRRPAAPARTSINAKCRRSCSRILPSATAFRRTCRCRPLIGRHGRHQPTDLGGKHITVAGLAAQEPIKTCLPKSEAIERRRVVVAEAGGPRRVQNPWASSSPRPGRGCPAALCRNPVGESQPAIADPVEMPELSLPRSILSRHLPAEANFQRADPRGSDGQMKPQTGPARRG